VTTKATSPLRVNVAELLRRSGTRRHVDEEVRLEGLAVTDSEVPGDEPIRLDVRLESLNEGVVATGTVTTRWHGTCRRCLRPVVGTLAGDVLEVFETDPDEGETRPLEGTTIDFEPVVRDTVLLELPVAPLCREDCPGLCPQCGADLAEGACDCRIETRDPRWAALDQLRFDRDPESAE
jgi:uncharacterized protein